MPVGRPGATVQRRFLHPAEWPPRGEVSHEKRPAVAPRCRTRSSRGSSPQWERPRAEGQKGRGWGRTRTSLQPWGKVTALLYQASRHSPALHCSNQGGTCRRSAPGTKRLAEKVRTRRKGWGLRNKAESSPITTVGQDPPISSPTWTRVC